MMQTVTHQKESILDALYQYKLPHHNHYKVNARKQDKDKQPLSLLERLVLRTMVKSLINKIKNDMKGSYRTTVWGLVAAVGIAFGVLGAQLKALTDDDPATTINIEVVCTTLAGIVGLFKMGQNARDKGVSTEEERAAALPK